MATMRVDVQGGGPAGAAAAIAARMERASVHLRETRRMPRHKVCGEFLSPEIAPALERLGLWREFLAARPGRIERVALRFGSRSVRATLAEPAYGMSRFRFDELLFRRACSLDAEISDGVQRETGSVSVLASGRAASAVSPPRGKRLFGFKAHYRGPVTDAVELFFFSRCYVGVNTVEDGITNVCGLAPEDLLAPLDFDYDAMVDSFPPLRDRLRPMSRAMEWLSTGPLVFGTKLSAGVEGVYPAGDALLFVDPFTGSGLLNAVSSGRLAGIAAARGTAQGTYLQQCRKMFSRPFAVAGLCRTALAAHCAEFLAPLVPARLLFALTRTRMIER
ncbi:MAG: NAD(P)/FAD-dependent oxidoreductase [Bryobacteraceae bacterium]